MSTIATLSARARDRAGKGSARAARREGLVPAVIYGDKKDPFTITVTLRDLEKLLKPGFFSHLVDIDVAGEKHRVLPRDLQQHPVTDRALHVDFLRVTSATKITVEVPVVFDNEETSPGIKRGGVLNIVRHEVELECRADAIPHALHVDLATVDIGDSIHISHISLPDGVKPTITDRDFTIATVAAPTVMEISDEEEGEEAAEQAEAGESADEE